MTRLSTRLFTPLVHTSVHSYPVNTKKTAHIANVTDPVWGETLELQLPSYVPFPPMARFAIYDEDGKKDTLISTLDLQLTQGVATADGFAAAEISKQSMPDTKGDAPDLALSFKYKASAAPNSVAYSLSRARLHSSACSRRPSHLPSRCAAAGHTRARRPHPHRGAVLSPHAPVPAARGGVSAPPRRPRAALHL